MQFLIIFAIGAFIGLAYGDSECFFPIFSDCSRSAVEDDAPETQFPALCNGVKKQMFCLTEKSIRCGMGFREEAKNVSQNLKHLCTNGTAMNTEFEQHKKCFSESGMSQVCFEPINSIMKDRLDTKDVVLGQKLTCKLLDDFSSCVVRSVRDECGAWSVDFFSSLFDPLVRLSKGLCAEIIFPANENDDRLDNPGMMSVYQIIAVFFKSP